MRSIRRIKNGTFVIKRVDKKFNSENHKNEYIPPEVVSPHQHSTQHISEETPSCPVGNNNKNRLQNEP